MKGKYFYNKFQKKEISFHGKRTTSAVLIPQKFIHIMQKLEITKNRTEILRYLISRFKSVVVLQQIRISNQIKTQYQKSGQNLQRITFKPENKDWVELGILATGLGCSRTLVFSIFLELEARGVGNFFNMPKVKNEVDYFKDNKANIVWRLNRVNSGFQRIIKYLRP